MPAPYFPTGYFGFMVKETDIERRTLDGGESITGARDKVATDGGGRVFSEFSDGALVDRPKVLAWRALLGILDEGVTPVVVPLCDVRHSPFTPGAGGVPHSDDTPFDDETLYVGGAPYAEAAAPAALRATSLQWTLTADQPILGGEWFSIEHASKGWRAYKINTIIGDTITFRPPLREAVTLAQHIELRAPRYLAVQDGRASSALQAGRSSVAAIRFVEAP